MQLGLQTEYIPVGLLLLARYDAAGQDDKALTLMEEIWKTLTPGLPRTKETLWLPLARYNVQMHPQLSNAYKDLTSGKIWCFPAPPDSVHHLETQPLGDRLVNAYLCARRHEEADVLQQHLHHVHGEWGFSFENPRLIVGSLMLLN